jgi:hypothetical protein
MTTAIEKTLTKQQAMGICEKIRDGMGVVGDLLAELHRNKGWLALGYSTWKECCEREFQHPTWWAKRQLKVAEIRKSLPPPPAKVDPPKSSKEGINLSHRQPDLTLNDAATIELGKVPAENRTEVLEAATERAGDRPPTAKIIKQTAAELMEDDLPPEPATIEEAMYAANTILDQFSRKIGALVKEADTIDNAHLTSEKHSRLETVKAQLRAAAATVRAAKGEGRCTYCDGGNKTPLKKSCPCLATGWLTKTQLESAPDK